MPGRKKSQQYSVGSKNEATRQKPTAKTNGELHSQRPPDDKNMMKNWVGGFNILSTSGYLLNPTMSRLAVTRETKSLNDGTYIEKTETSRRKNKSEDKPYNESVMKHIYKTGV